VQYVLESRAGEILKLYTRLESLPLTQSKSFNRRGSEIVCPLLISLSCHFVIPLPIVRTDKVVNSIHLFS